MNELLLLLKNRKKINISFFCIQWILLTETPQEFNLRSKYCPKMRNNLVILIGNQWYWLLPHCSNQVNFFHTFDGGDLLPGEKRFHSTMKESSIQITINSKFQYCINLCCVMARTKRRFFMVNSISWLFVCLLGSYASTSHSLPLLVLNFPLSKKEKKKKIFNRNRKSFLDDGQRIKERNRRRNTKQNISRNPIRKCLLIMQEIYNKKHKRWFSIILSPLYWWALAVNALCGMYLCNFRK